MILPRLHAVLALAACIALSCSLARCQQGTATQDVEGRLFFPIGRAPPISSIQVRRQEDIGPLIACCGLGAQSNRGRRPLDLHDLSASMDPRHAFLVKMSYMT